MKLNKLHIVLVSFSVIALLTACGDVNSNSNNMPKQNNSSDHASDNKESYIQINGGIENRKP